jgi:general secretion pathway protein C
MVRYLGWLANTVLFTLCCFLVANTANAIIAAWLSQSPARAVELGPRGGSQNRSWNDRQQITQRNLFHSATLSAPASTPAAPTDEELKETELPLKLWGTIAAEDPTRSWASVQETGRQQASSVYRVGDQIQKATIVEIERRRIVLLENGNRRSLSLDEEDNLTSKLSASAMRSKPPTRQTSARAERRKSTRAARKKAEIEAAAEAAVEAAKIESPVGNPSSLYSQARIVPEIDPETNVVTGLQLSSIQAGSIFEAVGIQNGEVITEIDGVPISDMGPSTKIMSALTDPDEVEIVTIDANGKAHRRVLVPPR